MNNVIQLDSFLQPLSFFFKFIDRITNQCFRHRRSRCDDTFKGDRMPVELKRRQESVLLSSGYLIEHIYVSIPVVNSGVSSMVFPWSSTGGLMSYTARTQDTIEYNELSLRCLPGHILGKNYCNERVFWRE